MVELLEFVQQTYLILVAVLGVIGFVIKNTQAIPDKYIPLILLILGAILGGLMGTQTEITMFDSVMQGILCAGLSIGVNQVPKQLTKVGE